MKPLENLQPLFEEGLYKDFERHLEEIVIERIMKFDNDLKGKNFYLLKITKTPIRTNYHNFDFEKLNEISRLLVNGMTSLGTIPNRKFWNKYFHGGVRTISISQNHPEDFPSFTLNYIVYSDYDNLDVRIISQLSTRIKMIDPTLSFKFEYLGTYDISIIKESLDSTTKFDLSSLTVEKLGQKNLGLMLYNPLQRPRFIGGLFKPVRPV
jgi:hypothetical protein